MSVNTKIFKIDPDNPDKETIKSAAKILREGGLLAFPTETVYGLGANALDKSAAKRIYEAKGRPSDNPLIVHIADFESLEILTDCDLSVASKLADSFWPGPLTMVLKKSEVVPFETTGGLDTVAVRMPSRPSARMIIKESCVPVAAPSANISGKPSPTLAKHVIQDFNGRIEGIVDDGPSPIGLESTIIDISGNDPTVLRRGFIRNEEIESVLGSRVVDSFGSPEPDKPKAPGMKYKHYAPKARLVIVEGNNNQARYKISQLIDENKRFKTAVITYEENSSLYKADKIYSLGKLKDGKAIMRNLYATLRQLDDDGIEYAVSEGFYNNEYSGPIMERLIRASAGNVINVK